ncbi:hypothetical protein O3M35_010335 [Rhynocoris fuscipes]|uniref:Uncharacterized protein n=1 Tax=Rhynocoris fuscipes TaxID=488301 RepID=A0AAW1CZZ8_9HEMI
MITEPQLGGAISTSSPPAPPPPPRQYRAEYRWQTSSSGVPLPVNAVVAGWDSFGNLIYAGRAVHEGNLLPAKIIPDHGCAYISYAGEEHRKMEYEVLCGQDLGWKADSCDRVPREAIRVGYTADGEHLYMGRLRMSDVFPNANGMSYSRGAYRWERSSGDLPVPLDAVQASSEVNRGPIYAGRAYHERDLLPAKVIPSHGCAYISYHGEEFRKVEYEVIIFHFYNY